VPSVSQRRGSRLLRHLKPEDVERVRQAVLADTTTGKRNHAMVLLIARLRLRASESGAWISKTPDDCSYSLTMYDAGGCDIQEMWISREEFIYLKQILAARLEYAEQEAEQEEADTPRLKSFSQEPHGRLK
jgi:hypothetical protein